jgi:hypothetical protein
MYATPTLHAIRVVRHLIIIGSLAACASAGVPSFNVDEPNTFVEAVNPNMDVLELRLAVNGVEFPLGRLPAYGARKFLIPPRYVITPDAEYQLTARPRGGSPAFASPSFSMRRGQTVSWTIELRQAFGMARAS